VNGTTSSSDCINLKEEYGDKYRIRWEEPANSRWLDPWYQYIPCRFGHIYPHGGGLLGFASRKRGPVANRVESLPYAKISQDGDDGMNIIFPAEHFEQVAEIVQPRRRRRLSEENRARLVESGRQFHFSPGSNRPENVRERA